MLAAALLIAASPVAAAPIEVRNPPRALPALTFKARDAQTLSLASISGRVTVLHVWATWCASCRAELSSLLGFQEAFANRDVALVTVSIERLGWPAIDRTLKELDANALHVTIAGALHGAPLPVVNCITNEVRVPAEAEIVIEGRLLPHEREMESSFGELPQYYGEPAKCHVIEVTALTHRKNAIFHTIVGGGLEHLLLGGIPREATLGNSGRSRDGT